MQGITVEHLLDSQHARLALETLLVAEQCANGRNSVSGASCQLAQIPGRVSAASGT